MMPVEGHLRNLSPVQSIRKVRDLFKRGDIEKVEVLLSISPSEIIIKDGSTRVRRLLPRSIVKCSLVHKYKCFSWPKG